MRYFHSFVLYHFVQTVHFVLKEHQCHPKRTTFNILLCDIKSIRRLKMKHRNINRATDALCFVHPFSLNQLETAFRTLESMDSVLEPAPNVLVENDLGIIALCPCYIIGQCLRKRGTSLGWIEKPKVDHNAYLKSHKTNICMPHMDKTFIGLLWRRTTAVAIHVGLHMLGYTHPESLPQRYQRTVSNGLCFLKRALGFDSTQTLKSTSMAQKERQLARKYIFNIYRRKRRILMGPGERFARLSPFTPVV